MLNLTQHDYAQKVGVSIHTIRSWERGKRIPSIARQILLTEFLKTR